MGHHLLNGVKCVREARGLTNALIIWRWTGRGEECAGGEVMTRHWADAINYHWGGLRRRQGLVSPRLPRSQTSFHVSKPSLGIWTGKKKKIRAALFPLTVIPRLEKEGNAPFLPFPASPSTFQRPGITLAWCDLLFIIPVKLDASSSPRFCTLLSRDGGWLGGGGAGLLESPHLKPSATIAMLRCRTAFFHRTVFPVWMERSILRMEGGARTLWQRLG